ncbi:MAG: HAD family phosphatase [Oscillospiraceae bacterium]
MIKGVIFDMDGLLLDTEILYQKAWFEYGDQNGYDINEELLTQLRGQNAENIERITKGVLGDNFEFPKVRDYCFAYLYKCLGEGKITVKKGAIELLKYLKENGYKIALATSSGEDIATDFLKANSLLEFFDEKAFGGMVKNSKPAPDIFLLAAKLLGEKAEDCLVLEDSPNGIRAGAAAGCTVIMVPDMDAPTKELVDLTAYVCEDLRGVIYYLAEQKLAN